MPWKRLEDIFAGNLEDVLKTSWRRLQNVLKTSWRRLEDIWPRQIYWSWPRRLEDVLKTSSENVRLRRTYSYWSSLLKTMTKDVFKTSSRRLHQDQCLLGKNFYATFLLYLKSFVPVLKLDVLQPSIFSFQVDVNEYV